MSHPTPKPPKPCHLPSVQAQSNEPAESIADTLRSPTLEYTKPEKALPVSQARKRAIAVLIVLTNLVPVSQPTPLPPSHPNPTLAEPSLPKMISFGLGLGGGLTLGRALGVYEPSQAAWIPASYSYVSPLSFKVCKKKKKKKKNKTPTFAS